MDLMSTMLIKLEHTKSPLPNVSNVEMVYDISSETITRAVHGGSLIDGLRLLTLKQDGHNDLRGSDRQSVIPYVHEDNRCIVVCVLQARVELV
jgi:hypothetical protein